MELSEVIQLLNLKKIQGTTSSYVSYRERRVFEIPIDKLFCIGYIRLISDIQSLIVHYNQIKEYVEKNGHTFFCIFFDIGDTRMAFDEMVNRDLISKKATVIVPSILQFGLGTLDALNKVDKLNELKCKLIILDKDIDVSTISGKMTFTCISAVYESDITSEWGIRYKSQLREKKEKTGFYVVNNAEDIFGDEDNFKL